MRRMARDRFDRSGPTSARASLAVSASRSVERRPFSCPTASRLARLAGRPATMMRRCAASTGVRARGAVRVSAVPACRARTRRARRRRAAGRPTRVDHVAHAVLRASSSTGGSPSGTNPSNVAAVGLEDDGQVRVAEQAQLALARVHARAARRRRRRCSGPRRTASRGRSRRGRRSSPARPAARAGTRGCRRSASRRSTSRRTWRSG